MYDFLAPAPGQRILDAGCARGRFLKALQPCGADLYGVDLTTVFLQHARHATSNLRLSQGSLSALPFASGSFDGIYCIEVLEHLPDTALAIQELARVLKPGGKLLVVDKNLAGLCPACGLPNWLVKPWRERRGRWMYPPDFPFRERWFWPWRLAAVMRRYFPQVQTQFLPDGYGTVSKFYRCFPFLSLQVGWIGTKSEK